jgi:hypothetical protein
MEAALQDLRMAFQGRLEPKKWALDELHPVDLLDATDFVRDIQAGKDRALLFQSAIPYFALLTDEARAFLLPDYLATIVKYESHIISAVSELEDEGGKVFLASLSPAEQSAVSRFIEALARLERMQFYSEDIRKLTNLLKAGRTSQMQ